MNFIKPFKSRWFWFTLGVTFLVARSAFNIYQDKTEYWRKQATLTFENILHKGVQKHDTVSFDNSSNGSGTNKLRHYSRDSVDMRLGVDSLNRKWSESLNGVNIHAKTNLRLSLSNGEVYHSDASSAPSANDSLFVFYLGPHHEVEITGYFSYHWYNIADGRLPIMAILSMVVSLIPAFFLIKMLEHWKPSLFKKKASVSEEENAVEVIATPEKQPVYQLEKDVFFDVHQRSLKRKDIVETLTPQQAMLLEAFLKADKYKLTQNEIDTLLWPDGSGTMERLYTAISRLRKSLEKMSSFQVDCQIDVYQLKKVKIATKNTLVLC